MAGQLTLAMIKPHCVMERKVGKILTRIEEANFGIVLAKMVQLNKEGARQFYQEHAERPFYSGLCDAMHAGPIWVLVLAKPNAVEEWRNTIGATNPAEASPESVRHEFGNHQKLVDNAVHGSATDHDAKKEINFFFARELKLVERIQELGTK